MEDQQASILLTGWHNPRGPEPPSAGVTSSGKNGGTAADDAEEPYRCRNLPPVLHFRRGRTASGSAPARAGHAVSKAAISAAADLRATLAAGGVGAS
jgi:hypothetical protein